MSSPQKNITLAFSVGKSFRPFKTPRFHGLNLLRPAEVNPHALANEQRGQSHIDIPRATHWNQARYAKSQGA